MSFLRKQESMVPSPTAGGMTILKKYHRAHRENYRYYENSWIYNFKIMDDLIPITPVGGFAIRRIRRLDIDVSIGIHFYFLDALCALCGK